MTNKDITSIFYLLSSIFDLLCIRVCGKLIFEQIRNIKKLFTYLAKAVLVVIQSFHLIILQWVICFDKQFNFVRGRTIEH